MRALVQRVSEAKVTVDQETVARIGHGLLVFLGIGHQDGRQEVDWLAGKIARLRIFHDEDGKMNRSVLQAKGEILVVSQFTLYGNILRGNRPSFSDAARPEQAEPLYEAFCASLRGYGVPVSTGRFAAMMGVQLINDGPVTLWMETPD